MNRKESKYIFINSFIILISALYFMFVHRDFEEIFKGESFFSILVLIVTVLFVHVVKSGRLFLALYGSDISFKIYLKTYCKVTPVSVVLPFKIGEFFRMYCYGKQLENGLKGIILILLDRFMDTIALVTAIFLTWTVNGGNLTSFIYMLLIFLAIIILIYFVFPGVYGFWKKFLLRAKASRNKIMALRILEALNLIYIEIKNIVTGRGSMLFFLSLTAWGVEIGSLALLNKFLNNNELDQVISQYLISAMNGNPSSELNRFVFISVVMSIFLYSVLKVCEIIEGKKGGECK